MSLASVGNPRSGSRPKLITMREALESDGYVGRLLGGESWAAWRVLLITIVGEELTEDERAVFNSLTGRAAGSLLGRGPRRDVVRRVLGLTRAA